MSDYKVQLGMGSETPLFEHDDPEEACAGARRYAVRTGGECPRVLCPGGSWMRVDLPGRPSDRDHFKAKWDEARRQVAEEQRS